jgi:hypothetical protein
LPATGIIVVLAGLDDSVEAWPEDDLLDDYWILIVKVSAALATVPGLDSEPVCRSGALSHGSNPGKFGFR